MSLAATSLSTRAYDRFKELLFTQRLKLGSVMSQAELSALLDVSVTPLRDAIRTLQAEGLVVVQPRSGIHILKPDTDLIRHTFQLRRLLEREAVRRTVETASDEAIAGWRQAHLTLSEDVSAGLAQPALGDRAAALDRGFHDAMIALLNNPVIASVYARNEERIALTRLYLRYATHAPTVRQTLAEHMALIDAFAHRDAKAAAVAMERHMDLALHRALGL